MRIVSKNRFSKLLIRKVRFDHFVNVQPVIKTATSIQPVQPVHINPKMR
jgi:hypothetical protein